MGEAAAAFGLLFWLWCVIAWMACAVFCATIADAKNRNGGTWVFAGLFFGIIGLIAIAGMPVRRLLPCANPACGSAVDAVWKKCPSCKTKQPVGRQ